MLITESPVRSRLRTAWTAAHTPVAGVPRWTRIAAYAIPFTVLLSIVSELLAFAAVGLVANWGEVFPRWVVGLRGRRVPVLAAVIPATVGAAALTMLWSWTTISFGLGITFQGDPVSTDQPLNFHDWKGVLAVISYTPLLLWGPLLGAVTIAYWRRRRAT